MKHPIYIFSIWTSLFSLLLLTGCNDDTISSQDNAPPSINQVPAAASQASPDNVQEIPGQYIVVYKDQWNGRISTEAGQQAQQFVDERISELGIDVKAVKHRYQYALRGFAAKLSSTQLKVLHNDTRVDYIEQDRTFKAFASTTPSAAAISYSGQTTPWGISRVHGPLNGNGKKAWLMILVLIWTTQI